MKHKYETAALELILLSDKDLLRTTGETNEPDESEDEGVVELPKVPLG